MSTNNTPTNVLSCLLCKSTSKLVVTKCGHVYCWSCIRHKIPGYCPRCSAPISRKTIVSIFNEDDNSAKDEDYLSLKHEQESATEEHCNDRPEQRYEGDGSNYTNQHSIFHVLDTILNGVDSTQQMSAEEHRELFNIKKEYAIVIIAVMVILLLCIWIN